jgi:hypothetical protein
MHKQLAILGAYSLLLGCGDTASTNTTCGPGTQLVDHQCVATTGGAAGTGGGSTAAGGGSGTSCTASGAACDAFTPCCGVCTGDAIDPRAVKQCSSLCKLNGDCSNGCCVKVMDDQTGYFLQACMSRRYCPSCGFNHTVCTTDDDCCSPFYCLPFSGLKLCMPYCILDTDCTRSDLFRNAEGCCLPVPNTTQKACFPPSSCPQVKADAGQRD